jgi:hypothetical protein
MKRMIVLILVAFIPICGCDDRGDEVESTDNIDSTSISPLTVQLPGILIAPTGDTVQAPPGIDVILYYWLPLEKYDEMQEDLFFLASLDSLYLVIPLQPNHESRNHAQRVVNNIGISLPVFLADSAVMEVIDTSILPSCLILTSDGCEFSENGFGAPSRLLIQIQSGE